MTLPFSVDQFLDAAKACGPGPMRRMLVQAAVQALALEHLPKTLAQVSASFVARRPGPSAEMVAMTLRAVQKLIASDLEDQIEGLSQTELLLALTDAPDGSVQ